jgi:hypothetical protein
VRRCVPRQFAPTGRCSAWAGGACTSRRSPEDIAADELELTVSPRGERVLLGDGERMTALPSMERLVDLGWGNVIRARRLDGQLWEVEFASL